MKRFLIEVVDHANVPTTPESFQVDISGVLRDLEIEVVSVKPCTDFTSADQDMADRGLDPNSL